MSEAAEEDDAAAESEPSEADQADTETETRSHDLGHGEMIADEKTDPETALEEDVDAADSIEGVLAIRQTLQASATQLIGREFDAVSEVVPTEEGWQAIVEVVERRSVPDTQDVIGRYEVELDADGVVHGYRRLDRYRRGDTTQFE